MLAYLFKALGGTIIFLCFNTGHRGVLAYLFMALGRYHNFFMF